MALKARSFGPESVATLDSEIERGLTIVPFFQTSQLEVRAGRQPGRADIADHLAARDALARGDGEAAHMAIAARDAAAVIELDEIAVTAVAAGHHHAPVDRRIDRRAVRGGEVEPLVHAQEAEQRMAAHAEGGGNAARHRHAHEALTLRLAIGIPELAAVTVALFPADEAKLLRSLIEAGELQLADLNLASGGAGVIGDDVEPVVGTDRAD